MFVHIVTFDCQGPLIFVVAMCRTRVAFLFKRYFCQVTLKESFSTNKFFACGQEIKKIKKTDASLYKKVKCFRTPVVCRVVEVAVSS